VEEEGRGGGGESSSCWSELLDRTTSPHERHPHPRPGPCVGAGVLWDSSAEVIIARGGMTKPDARDVRGKRFCGYKEICWGR